MTTTQFLTRDIGQVERALLERLLNEAGLSLLAWTVPNFFDAAGPLVRSDLTH